ncbi:glycoside hydrolase family 95 protein [Gracilibacillus caseinilyticus]|uniref:Glycoside hydrolase family 95 protein n=1 Tax=Gracilibacillus caseinilyticus TaxID=2932256 RepID=A0ABY4ERB2_9BACI|nr:glycoside hydrolase family 95 protein [Gracilibacillus caseinilyticus]UOQ46975.1 glycoside hydrolase family 95 protein [Gracilibacillus caseinilyticus]
MHPNNKCLWYKEPAGNWNEALPVGNGRIGGMVFGHVSNERIQLNEDSIWYGGPRDRLNPDAFSHLNRVRELLANGNLYEAEELAKLSMSGIPKSQRHYEPLGEINIDFDEINRYKNYYRALDLNTAIVNTEFVTNNITYQREVFTSYPDQVMVIRLSATEQNSISFQASLDRGNTRNLDTTEQLSSSSIVMGGETGGRDGIAFAAVLKVIAEDGDVRALGNRICVNQASEVTILLTAATTYRFEDPKEQCVHTISCAARKGYYDLRKTHITDYQTLFQRVELTLADHSTLKKDLPTDERLKLLQQGKIDLGLIDTYFHFGRYLMIASSRPNSLPATLQGIWNDLMFPPWDSKYTININAQMNYWPAEVCNLSECHVPLLKHIEKMKNSGRITAKKMYNCRGFTAHHNTDIWGDTAPQDIYPPASYWPMGAAWLCLHLWEHFQYSTDVPYLKQAYETMKEAALFFVDFLIENNDGYLITTPSVSPENTYILPDGEKGRLCEAPSMDSQIIDALLSSCIKASDILGMDKEFSQQLSELRDKLPPIKIGKHGQIQEWLEDYEEAEPGHRHISHLFSLHPSNQISPITTPALAKAAEVTLNRRLAHGGGHTGWSRAWIINMWARLHDSEAAYDNVVELLKSSTLPNLFDNHPPFQIDGNFGGTAGIIEMIVQSQNDEIHFLPAIPKAWEDGYVRGVKARGGYELEFEWKQHQLQYINIHAVQSGTVRIRVDAPVKVDNQVVTQKDHNLYEVLVEADQTSCILLHPVRKVMK